MQGFGRRLAAMLAAPFVLLALWFVAGLAGALLPGKVAHQPGAEIHEIRLIGTAIHYDLALPLTPEIRARFAFAQSAGVPLQDPNAAWLLIGWGARGFYTQAGSYADLPLAATARAAFGDASVVRLEVWPAFPPEEVPQTQTLHLSDRGLAALLDHITAELGAALPGASLTGTDAFFHGQTRFSALRTCNVWLGEALRTAGQPLGAWTPTPQALRLSLWWNDRPQTRFFAEKSRPSLKTP